MAVNIIRQKERTKEQLSLKNGRAYFKKHSHFISEKRYFAWAKVIERYSDTCTVDLTLDSGILLKKVAVASREWAGSNTIGFGERDLPPKDSLVLVVFPYGNIEESLVICSSFTRFDTTHYTKQISELLVASKEKEKLTITEAGNKFKENKETGEVEYTHKSGTKITIANDGEVTIDAVKDINVESDTKIIVKGTKVELGTTLKKLVNETLIDLYNGHTHVCPAGTSLVTTSLATVIGNCTSKTEAE